MSARWIVIERDMWRGFRVAFDPPLVGDQPQRFPSHAEAVAHALGMQKAEGCALRDLTGEKRGSVSGDRCGLDRSAWSEGGA